MKITCEQSDLMKGISIVSKAVPGRTPMDILYCILIDATGDHIKLMANDMEIGIETIIEGTIIEKGNVAIDAGFFQNQVRTLSDAEVTIETDPNNQVRISCEKFHVNYPGKNGDDFALIPAITRNEPVIISQFTLRELIRQTIFSVSDNENNKVLTGELFEIKDNKLRVVSLDTLRISIRRVNLKSEYEDKRVIVPGKSLNEISKIITGSIDDEVRIFITDNHIIFEFDQTVVVSRLIAGEYLRFEHMFSNDYVTKIMVNKNAMLKCIDRTIPAGKEGEKKPIILNITDNIMKIGIAAAGNTDEELEIKKEGKDMRIGFNPKFFQDAFRVIDEEEVAVYFLDPKAPCYIKDENGTYNYIILPIDLNNISYLS